jgi:5-methylcytosine-specific restriction endonuclease McrA
MIQTNKSTASPRKRPVVETPAVLFGNKSMSEYGSDSDNVCPTCGEEFASRQGVAAHHQTHDKLFTQVLAEKWVDQPLDEWLREAYLNERLTLSEIGERLNNIDATTVGRLMERYGIQRRSRSEITTSRWEKMSESERETMLDAAHSKTRELVEAGEHNFVGWADRTTSKNRRERAKPAFQEARRQVEAGEWHLQTDIAHCRQGYGEGWTEEKRERVRKQQDRKCAACGDPEDDRLLDVHHIKPAGSFDDAEKRNATENLVALCRSCHMKWEGIPLRPELSD